MTSNFSDQYNMVDRETIASDWASKVVPVHPVPEKLFDHQMDAMSLIKQGKNVFLGNSLLAVLPLELFVAVFMTIWSLF